MRDEFVGADWWSWLLSSWSEARDCGKEVTGKLRGGDKEVLVSMLERFCSD